MEEGGFKLHKWHYNQEKHLSKETTVCPKKADAKFFGNPWNTKSDRLFVQFDSCFGYDLPLTKRKMLSAINSVKDILGFSSPVMITGKIIFSETCFRKCAWDTPLGDEITNPWQKWIKLLKEFRL